MKKIITLLFAIVICLNAKSQVVYLDNPDNVQKMQDQMKEQRKQFKVSMVRNIYISVLKKRHPYPGIKKIHMKVDEQGNVAEYFRMNRRNKIIEHWINSYDKDNRFVKTDNFCSNGKLKKSEVYEYDSNGNMTESKIFCKKPENLCYHSISIFDNKNNILEMKLLFDKDKKPGPKYVYEYYPDGTKKQTTEFNKRNKIRHVWKYDCNPVGDQTLKIEANSICIHEELDKDGNKIKIKEENKPKGRIRRIISKIDKNNNVIEEISYSGSGKIMSKWITKYDERNNIVEKVYYNKNNTEPDYKYAAYYNSVFLIEKEEIYRYNSPTPKEVWLTEYGGK